MKLVPEAEAIFRLQDYSRRPAIAEVQIVELRRYRDDGGSMTELARLDGGRVEGIDGFVAAQVNYSTVQPGAVKAFHVHRRQTDVWFVPPGDRLLLVLVDVREGSPTKGTRMRILLGDGVSRLVRIPPGVAHGCRNLGGEAATIVYFTDRPFSEDPREGDEGRLRWDFAGAEIWEVPKE
jgi:dTDP-4-dehydrorhamnose 3,5-epimerase